jgi:hypothetical protein
VPRADKPWKSVARVLVLYDTRGVWRYAVYSDVGVVDGVLDDLPERAALEHAQAALLAHVTHSTGHRYTAAWQSHDPHLWTADISPLDPSGGAGGDQA